MAWREIIYQYDGSFEGLLCCVFESYTKERPTAILRDGDDEPSLFEICAVTTDRAHAQRIYRSLYKRSPEVGSFLRRAFLTCLPDKEMAIYRFIVNLPRGRAAALAPERRHLSAAAQGRAAAFGRGRAIPRLHPLFRL